MECIGNYVWFLRMGGGGFRYSGGGVCCGSLFLYICGDLVSYMRLLRCLIRRVWDKYLGISFGMTVCRRIYVFGLGQF